MRRFLSLLSDLHAFSVSPFRGLGIVVCIVCLSPLRGWGFAQTPVPSLYDHALASNTAYEPEFIDGLYMDAHCRKTTMKNIVHLSGNALNAAPEAGVPEKKFIVVNNQVLLVDDTRLQKTDSGFAAIRNTEPAPAEPAGDKVAENQGIQLDVSTNTTEITTDDPLITGEEVIEPVIARYAEMISVDPSDITNYPLYRFIDKWYGTKYKWGGEDNTGIDCSAFSQKLYENVYYTAIARTAREQHRQAERIKHYDEASEGDLIFFRIHRLRISHVGVYLANGYFVHASRSKGIIISSLNTKYWQRRYASCGRIEHEEKGTESDAIQ